MSSALKRNNKIKALEMLTAFTRILEKSEQIVTSKYQVELMEIYWALAVLHDQMHYLAYTRKYAMIALNIAERTGQHGQIEQIKLLLEKIQ